VSAPDPVEELRAEVARLREIVERQQRRLDELAAVLSPEEVVGKEASGVGGDALWQRLGLAEGERRTVTVLFADVSGFTALGERLDPEEFQLVMRDTMTALAGCVHRQEGYLEKFIGDAICAIFGAPVAHEDEPQRAARTALDMHRVLVERSERRPDLQPLTVHIGINTGPVIAGAVGDGSQFGVMGDTINTAARLMGLASAGQTFASAESARRLRRQFRLEDMGLHEVKGKTKAVAAFNVVAEIDRRETAGGGRFLADLVDREAEMAALRGVLDEATVEHRGATVLVTGEAGVGKTRLVDELADRAGDGRRILRSTARLAGDRPYALLAGALAPLVDELGHGDDREIAAALFRGGGAAPPEFEVALARTVARAAADRPLLVVLDDVDRADEGSVELAHYLTRASADRAVVWLLVARKEPGAFVAHDDAHLLRLDPLPDAATAELFERLLPGALTPAHRTRLARQADGNPTFVHEIAQALVDEGIVAERDAGTWRLVGDPLALEIPESVTELIEARLDTLPTSARVALQEAAVIGLRFGARLLARISTIPSSLDAALAELAALDLVAPARGPGGADAFWVFRRQLVREVAYHSLLRRRRLTAHRAVAEALLELEPDRRDDNAELIAHHFDLSDRPARALPFLAHSLRHALEAHSTSAAAVTARKAITIAERHPEEVDRSDLAWFHERLAVCRFLTGERDGVDSLLAAVAIRRTQGDHTAVARGLERAGWYLTLFGEPENAEAHLAAAEEVVDRGLVGDEDAAGVRAGIGASRAFAAAAEGRLAAARRQAAEAASLASAAGDDFSVARARAAAGVVELWDGDPVAAIDHLRAALDLAWAGHQAVLADRCGRWLVVALTEAGAYGDALSLADPLLARADERNDASVGIGVRSALAALWRELGDLDRARRLADDAVRLGRGRSVASDALVGAHLARIHGELDDPRRGEGDAAAHLRELDELLERDPWLGWRLGARTELARARLALAGDDLDLALLSIDRARLRLGEAGAPRERSEAERLEGEVLARRGDPAGARRLEQALADAERSGSPFAVATVAATLARVSPAGEPARAAAVARLDAALTELTARAPDDGSGMVRASALALEAMRLGGELGSEGSTR
jgi:class 3 adenylate cyclase